MPGLDRDAVLDAMAGRFADLYHRHAVLKPNGGELRGPCPVHGGAAPNFAVSPQTGHWYCHSGCQAGGDVFDFLMKKEGLAFPEALAQVAAFAGLSPDASPLPRPTSSRAPRPAAPEGPFLDGAIAERLHRNLMDAPRVRTWLSEHRGFTTDTLTRFQVGLDPPANKGEEWRVCFPVRDRQGRLTNIRRHLFRYKSDLTEARRRELGKTKPWQPGLRADLYPLCVLEGATEALIVEGEADALLACQMGFCALTGTGGAGTWKPEWTEELRGLTRVTVLYDADEAGEKGLTKVVAAMAAVVPDVRVARYPALGKGDSE